jgi:two-component system nitrogen regulation sensor histidine kinase NtrY
MKLPLPSFRIQILFIVLILLLVATIFTRSFFINQFKVYKESINSLKLEDKVHQLYQNHREDISKEEIEPLLSDLKQTDISTDLFEKRLTLYSTFLIIFTIVIVFVIFIIFLTLLTSPLTRLQTATRKMAKGDFGVQVKEAPLSPINSLIVSFNSMAAELELSRNKLLQAEREMMWREMAQVMAHEIKNPLTPLQLSVQRLEEKYYSNSSDFDKVFADSVEIMNEEIDNLQVLVQEFSKFARMPSANFTFYNLNDQIKEIVTPYEKKVNIQLDLDRNLPEFYGDKMQIKQVLVNLIQNAIQATKSRDGLITIVTKYETLKFIISVEDNGEGIQNEDLDKIFRPYFTRREKGTGLGLAIVKRIVSQHNGNIEVESKREKGTKFTIKINRTEELR